MTEWKTYLLGDICKTNVASYSNKDGWEFVNYLDTGNITGNDIGEIQYINLLEEKLPSRAKRKVGFNSIIYSTVRPNQLHYGIIKEQPDNFLVSTGFTVIDVDENIADADFVYYWLTQSILTDQLHSIAEQSTSAYPSIKASDLEKLEIQLPSLEIQRKISSILVALDKKRKNNDALNRNLSKQAETIFMNEFLNFNKLPNGWHEGTLVDIADYLNGLAMQKFMPNDEEQGLPVLKIKELRQGNCNENSDRCSTEIDSKYIVNDGDVIFSWSGSLLIDFWCGNTCGLNQHLFKVTSKKYDKWFYYSWTHYHLDKFIEIAAAKATTMGHIKRKDLSDAKVFIPSKKDYERIASILQPIYDKIVTNRIVNRELEGIRDIILPKLMSGELDVSDIEI